MLCDKCPAASAGGRLTRRLLAVARLVPAVLVILPLRNGLHSGLRLERCHVKVPRADAFLVLVLHGTRVRSFAVGCLCILRYPHARLQ